MRSLRRTPALSALLLAAPLIACNGGDADDEGSASLSSGAATTGASGTATTTAGATTDTATDTATDGSASESASGSSATATTTTTDATTDASTATTATSESTSDTDTSAGTSTTDGVNQPPTIDSDPVIELLLQEILGGDFDPGQLFLASSVTQEIRVYDADTLAFLQSFTHPLFAETAYNPRGMAFNERGNLVVATYSTFIEFSDYGVVYMTYPKKDPEATENVIFDANGNMYTTTATGGTDRLNQYAAADYAFVQTVAGPPGAGQYTGITFDDQKRLYLASQSDNKIHVAEADADFTNFKWVKALPGSGPAVRLEGLVFNRTGELIVAQADLLRYNLDTETIAGSFDVPQDAWPVPVSVDNLGNIYTADFENGNGSLSADIVRFNLVGQDPVSINDPDLFGPFGLAISGTVLASDPPVLYTYQVVASDPDGDPLTYALIKGPPGMTVDGKTGLIQWLVTSKDLGVYDVIVEVSDGQGGSAQQMYMLEIKSS